MESLDAVMLWHCSPLVFSYEFLSKYFPETGSFRRKNGAARICDRSGYRGGHFLQVQVYTEEQKIQI